MEEKCIKLTHTKGRCKIELQSQSPEIAQEIKLQKEINYIEVKGSVIGIGIMIMFVFENRAVIGYVLDNNEHNFINVIVQVPIGNPMFFYFNSTVQKIEQIGEFSTGLKQYHSSAEIEYEMHTSLPVK